MTQHTQTIWVRTCQECGHQQKAICPDAYKSDRWRDLKCNKCHSISMDFGSWRQQDTFGNIIESAYEEDI